MSDIDIAYWPIVIDYDWMQYFIVIIGISLETKYIWVIRIGCDLTD